MEVVTENPSIPPEIMEQQNPEISSVPDTIDEEHRTRSNSTSTTTSRRADPSVPTSIDCEHRRQSIPSESIKSNISSERTIPPSGNVHGSTPGNGDPSSSISVSSTSVSISSTGTSPSLRPSLGPSLPSLPALPTTTSSNQRFSIHGIVQGLAHAVGKVRDREKEKNQASDGKQLEQKFQEALEPITDENGNVAKLGRIGVCALDIKARSKPCRFILNKLIEKGEFEIVIFGDKVILDEDIENWPTCDFLISFYSNGFPLRKAIAYAKLRKPFCVNDLLMQKVLWDRRLILRLLDMVKVPTAKRLEISRDGGPDLPDDVRELVERKLQYKVPPKDAPEWKPPTRVELSEDGNTLFVDGQSLRKPFVEKPVNGEDHNIHIYFKNGGGRRLFRKVGNKSSEYDPDMRDPRINGPGSYIYEQFLDVDNFEDVKAYTVGPDYCHAETRKSPVVDGLVRRNPQGKEVRFVTKLSKDEMEIASRICTVFGQRVCGFDMLRVQGHSYVIDVNGWSFVKDNNDYYDKCASILKQMFIQAMADKQMKASLKEQQQQAALQSGGTKTIPGAIDFPEKTRKRTSFQSLIPGRSYGSHDDKSGILDSSRSSGVGGAMFSSSPGSIASSISIHPDATVKETTMKEEPEPPKPPHHSWKLKGMVAILRHADRTPKQKFKLTFHSKPFIDLLNGHEEEVILVEDGLKKVVKAVDLAIEEGVEDMDKLRLLQNALERKAGFPGTKVQVKPFYIEPEEPGSPRPLTAIKIENAAPPKPEGQSLPSLMEAARIASASPEGQGSSSPKAVLASAELPTGAKTPPRRVLEKLQLIIKWGGEPTHSARYQAQDLGENMRKDLLLMNREALEDIEIYSSSERRVRASAQIWAGSFLGKDEIPDDFIQIRKDLLDDSNAAKRQMDAVKKEFKGLLREGLKSPPTFNWPKDMPDPCEVMKQVVELMKFLRKVMVYNFQKYSQPSPSPSSSLSSLASTTGSGNPTPLTLQTIQTRWCCGENADLFRERWEKLFVEFCDWEKVDPSKVSELYDTMKYDALHNRQFLETIFTPPSHMLDEEAVTDSVENLENSGGSTKETESKTHGLKERLSHRRRSIMHHSSRVGADEDATRSYVSNASKSRKGDYRLAKLRELYRLAKVLFDCVSPQEYGITNSEKLEIGLLTCLPLLKQIVKNLETVQASPTAKSFFYFTKESHVYTLLNCIIQGGIPTKLISSNPDLPHIDIPELDYLTQICFELYESEFKSKPGKTDQDPMTPEYSIRISLSVGCHTESPLDVDLDSKHCIGCKPRRSMTKHDEWKSVLERLKEKFDTVKLPKRFLPIMLSKDDCDRAV